MLNEAAAALQFVLPQDILMRNVLPFLTLPLPPDTSEMDLEDQDETSIAEQFRIDLFYPFTALDLI